MRKGASRAHARVPKPGVPKPGVPKPRVPKPRVPKPRVPKLGVPKPRVLKTLAAQKRPAPPRNLEPSTQTRLPILGQPPTPIERCDAARNRASILDAARKLLRKRPISDLSMDELAQTAGVGKGTLYRRFEDRSSLCRALLHDEALKIQARTLRGFDLPPDTPWVERLETFLKALFDFVTDNAVLLSEAVAFERGENGRFSHPAYAWQRDEIALYLKRAAEAGELSISQPEVTADLILAGLDPDLIRWHISHGATKREIEEAFQRLWRHGVLRAPCAS